MTRAKTKGGETMIIIDIDKPKRCGQCPMHNDGTDYCKLEHDHASFVRARGCPIKTINPQEPCEDMVSRGVFEQVMWERDIAITQLKELGYGLGEKPKTGRWIKVIDKIDSLGNKTWHYKCDKCGASRPPLFDRYCPYCGANMQEGEE